MEKLRKSSFLRGICYIMIPILVAMLMLSIFHMTFLVDFGNKEEEVEYVQTENFANSYLNFLIYKVYHSKTERRDEQYTKLEDEDGNLYCYFDEGDMYYRDNIGNYIDYILVERETGNKFTNIKSSNYQEVMNNMEQKKTYWNLVEGKIDTNLTYINQDNIRYNYSLNHISNSGSIEEYDIYSFYNEEKGSLRSNFLLNKNVYDFLLKHRTLPAYICVISSITLIIIAVYLFWSIGYKKGKEGIYLNYFDQIPYEIICIIGGSIILFILAIIFNFNDRYLHLMLIMYLVAYNMGYAICAIWGITTIKRIKARTFWKSFFIYKSLKWFYQKINKYKEEINKKTAITKKIFWYYWGFIVISFLLACFMGSFIAIIALVIFWLWVFYQVRQYIRGQEEIRFALEKIYQGDNEIYLDSNALDGILKEMAVYINDIAGGFSNAIEEGLRSERLKTELITNVSHDIKTPLTSIINYVDLLKKEDLQNEKIKEYVEILDRKSQRLKKLTEDLVEASKVSSGNVQLKIEEINLKELLNQTIGEFKDRFEEKMLQFEINMPKEEIKIQADNRYFYRIIENIFSNVTKYALENSRVYIDIIKNGSKMEMSVKNISKEKLNISSEELMQRFVRGDKSRYTEGSGLGLSIAKSLTELQGGKFNIYIDGDLFKVIIEW